jgi:hypothetical protein
MIPSVILVTLLLFLPPAHAQQLIVMTGYASSHTPEMGTGVSQDYKPFRAGGGYAFTTRVDIERRLLYFGPSFSFWNNLTGDPDPNENANYFQMELGGRALLHTRTVPSLYAGVGGGYTFAHGKTIHKFYGTKTEYDGDFLTGSAHFGVKTPSRTNGIGLLAEGSYHFGLEEPRGFQSIGPAKAWTIQIGVIFDWRYRGDEK